MEINATNIIALVSALLGGGGIGGFLTYRATKNKDNRNADAQLIATNLKLVDALLGRIDALEKAAVVQDSECDKKLEVLRKEVSECNHKITSLTIRLSKYENGGIG